MDTGPEISRHCAFLTLECRDGFFINDHLAYEPLQNLGWSVKEIPWTEANVDWARFDAVVIRSTWDYQKQPNRFIDTLQLIEASGTILLNPREICRWNIDKRYLRELERLGVPIIPTIWLEKLELSNLPMIQERFAERKIVVKPTVGANADDTFVMHSFDPADWQDALTVFLAKPLLVQPFVESIISEGEFSLFYFGGSCSHAILKTPAEADFRVQEEHGGSCQKIEPEPLFLDLGDRVVDAIGQPLLYARVDLVRMPGNDPAVMEVELIEPSLYFDCDPESAKRFAVELDRMVKAREGING